MSLSDIFNTDEFSMGTLTASINELAYVPQVINDLGIFQEAGVATTSVTIEKRGQGLALLPTKPRGAPGTPMVNDKRKTITLEVPHIPAEDYLRPDEIQNVRSFGSNNQMEGVVEVRDQKLLKMKQHLDLTLEYHKLGALQGLVLDADGSTLFDLFDEFGVAQPAIADFNLDAAWAAEDGGVVRAQITGVVRNVRAVLLGTPFRSMISLCGDDFFDKFTNHPEIRSTYLAQQEANALRESDPLDTVKYGGVTFINYYGFGDVAVDTDQCQFVPMGVPNLFITRNAPAPWFDAVNTIGLPMYTMATLDPTGQKEITLESQANPISLCTRPDALFRAKLT
jgi:hypothetical protein